MDWRLSEDLSHVLGDHCLLYRMEGAVYDNDTVIAVMSER